jgi:hypothetical protein
MRLLAQFPRSLLSPIAILCMKNHFQFLFIEVFSWSCGTRQAREDLQKSPWSRTRPSMDKTKQLTKSNER